MGRVRVTEGGTHKVQRGKELQVYDYICQQKGRDQDGISGAEEGERGIYVHCKGQSEKPVRQGAGGARCRRPPGNGEAVNHATYKENNRTIAGRAKSPKQSIRERKNVSTREWLLHDHPFGESLVGHLPVLSLCALVGVFPRAGAQNGWQTYRASASATADVRQLQCM